MKKVFFFNSFYILFITIFFTIYNAPSFSEGYTPLKIPVTNFKKIKAISGNINYYSLQTEDDKKFIRAYYKPPLKTVTLRTELPATTGTYSKLSWKWRVLKFPVGADERIKGRRDSAGAVYCIFREGSYNYTIKYVYSSAVPVSTIIKEHSLLGKMYVVVINSRINAEKGQWNKEEVNFKEDFKRLFKTKEVPPLQYIAIMTDGDGTKSEVITDYADFIILP